MTYVPTKTAEMAEYLAQAEKHTNYWAMTFSTHNLYKCHLRGCNCKTFFCYDVWHDRYVPFLKRLYKWQDDLERYLSNPSCANLVDDSEDSFWDVCHTYQKLSTWILEWQGLHATHRNQTFDKNLCKDCKVRAKTVDEEALDLLLYKTPPSLAYR